MTAETPKDRTPLELGVTLAKDIFALLRDSSLLLLAVLFMFFPLKLNEVLTTAGFEEGSIVGFKWKARLVDTDEALKAANGAIEKLQAQLKEANDTLAAAKAAVPASKLKDTIQRVEQAGRDVAAASDGAIDAAKSTIASNAPLVDKAQQGNAALGGGDWAVVLSSHKTLAAARGELPAATKAGLDAVGIYQRNGYFAILAVAPTRDKAAETLQIAKNHRPDAYLARLAMWCKSPAPKEGYTDCAPTR